MNDLQIYQLLARKPDSRAQDIADALNADLKEASEALRSLVDCGDVVRYSGTGRNGLPTQFYILSDTFKKSKDYAALMASAGAAPASPAVAQVVPQPAIAFEPQGSKVDRAVAFVLKHGQASDDDLRGAMGIVKPAAPAAYLVAAIKSGRLNKGANGWTPGPAAASKPITKPAIKAQVTPSPKQAEVVKERNWPAAAKAFVVETAPAVFRCGLWSDGVLELQRDGLQVTCLTRNEGGHLAEFMRRMLNTTDPVAQPD